MRRTLAATALTVATALSVLPSLPTSADPGDVRPALSSRPAQASSQALAVAARVLQGHSVAGDPDATLALRDLRLALPNLQGTERLTAESILARPTDGAADLEGDGYTKPSYKKCSSVVCVHYVKSGTDKPPTGWVNTTLQQMNKVWRLEVGTMGYRKPLGDGSKGGNSKLDVYLKEVGDKGYYGYCAPEKRKYRYTFSGYCVLDNDFDPGQFGGAPALSSLKVTAAHEFFHAVQFGYDADEDRWFMESTATWMEERYADNINDNQQYLPYGQVGMPEKPLDTPTSVGELAPYGNWAFWEYLTQRKGNVLVKWVWNQAATYKGAPDRYSTQALAKVLKTQGGFQKNYAAFASANTLPAKFYQEGAAWTGAPMTATHTLTTGSPTSGPQSYGINHLSSRNVKVSPGPGIADTTWRLRVSVDGPSSKTSPAANVLIVKHNGKVVRNSITLNKSGVGKGVYGFNANYVSYVVVTLANASTRFSCWQQSGSYSCHGVPRDDSKPFTYTVTAFQEVP